MEDGNLGLIITGIEKLGKGIASVATNPRKTGQVAARIPKWPGHFRLGIRDEIKYSKLLRRMYPNTGESSEIGVPRLDCLSDIERDLLLQFGIHPEAISRCFEEWFVTSGRLLDISKEILCKDSDLPEALADLNERSGSVSGMPELASVDLITSREDLHECIRRFDSIAGAKKRAGAYGWATRHCDRFPGALSDIRGFSAVAPDSNAVDLDQHELIESQKRSLAVSITSDCAELFYESGDGNSEVLKVNCDGIYATKVSDLDGNSCIVDWYRFVALILYESLKLRSSFSLREVALVLKEAIALRPDMARIRESQGSGAPVDRGLCAPSFGTKHQVSTHVRLLKILLHLSRSIRLGSQAFVEKRSKAQVVLGLTLSEARGEPPMAKYAYQHRNRAEEVIKNVLKSDPDDSQVREMATDTPFATLGELEYMNERLILAMRKSVESAQENYCITGKKRGVCNISGSLWLDRIAKGRFLTSERSKELTYRRRRQDVPQELSSRRELSFFLPLYDRTVVFPRLEDVINVSYSRMQIGVEADLTSTVSVLVALILWACGQNSEAVDAAIEADKEGTEMLVTFSTGRLGSELRKMLLMREDKGLKVSQLISDVGSLSGPMDRDWVIREALSVVSSLGITYTSASARTAGYLKAIEYVRSRNFASKSFIDADVPVPLEGVEVREVITERDGTEFIIQDQSIANVYEIRLTPLGGVTVDDLSIALEPRRRRGRRSLVVHIEAAPAVERTIKGSKYGKLSSVGVQ